MGHGMYLNDVYRLLLAPLHEGDLRQSCIRDLTSSGYLLARFNGHHWRPPIPHPYDDTERIPSSDGLFRPSP